MDGKLFTDKSSVTKFKSFIKKHPGLITAVRNKERTWKDTYEEWYLLGEDHETWEQYKSNNEESTESTNNSELFKNLLGVVKNMDINQLQNNITQVSGAISSIQELLNSFQKPDQGHQHQQHHPNQHHPFSFRKD
jgi:hypothetical protein